MKRIGLFCAGLAMLALVGCNVGGVSESSAESDAKQINDRIKQAGGDVPTGGTQSGS